MLLDTQAANHGSLFEDLNKHFLNFALRSPILIFLDGVKFLAGGSHEVTFAVDLGVIGWPFPCANLRGNKNKNLA